MRPEGLRFRVEEFGVEGLRLFVFVHWSFFLGMLQEEQSFGAKEFRVEACAA